MAKLTLPHPGHFQFPSTPACGGPLPLPPPILPLPPPPPKSGVAAAAERGAWQRLQTSRTAKFTFPHMLHFQFPSAPAIGAPLGKRDGGPEPPTAELMLYAMLANSSGLGIPQRLHASRIAKFTFLHDGHCQLPSTPGTGGPFLPPFPPAPGCCGAAYCCCARPPSPPPASADLGLAHRKQVSRLAKFEAPQESQSQFPPPPAATPALPLLAPLPQWNGCSSDSGFGIPQRLHAVRTAKFTF
mmetsp:Transcript_71751/g.181021  ORF Transcript_71751/g.181021 Transcript_71751/m.181021 type:complete len:242 (-) Transcript_71751:870-1595(-)